jgi:peptide/nickel transport system substrate-binding protein
MNTYIPEEHPLFNPNAPQYTYDPQAAGEILDAAGWRDLDADPETARTSLGVSGIPDGTTLSFQFITIQSGERENAAEIMAQSMEACGIAMEIVYTDVEQLFAPGPEGAIFGRKFDLAQFAWAMTLEPACELYTSTEIPGPYPEFIKGWGGTNPSGYSNPEFDSACQSALRALPDFPEHAEAHALAQAIFAQDLPVIPLYQRLRLIAARPDICNLAPNPSSSSVLWNLESLNYGEACLN